MNWWQPTQLYLRDDPPAVLNILAGIAWLVLIAVGQGTLLAAQQERGEVLNLQLGEMQIGHAEGFGLRLDLALVIDIRLGELVLEKSLVVIPRPLGRTFRQARQVFGIGNRLGVFAAALAPHS